MAFAKLLKLLHYRRPRCVKAIRPQGGVLVGQAGRLSEVCSCSHSLLMEQTQQWLACLPKHTQAPPAVTNPSIATVKPCVGSAATLSFTAAVARVGFEHFLCYCTSLSTSPRAGLSVIIPSPFPPYAVVLSWADH